MMMDTNLLEATPLLMRPTNVEALFACVNAVSPELDEALQRGLHFQPQASDVFISPYPKCGTTWMQQIVHGLRTGGSMDFTEISVVVPWLEMAYAQGIDIEKNQVVQPRVFKSHFSWNEMPKGGRYIYVTRDPRDALVSYYRFMDGWFFEQGALSIEEFAHNLLMSGLGEEGDLDTSYWAHLRSWWEQRDREDVLIVAFEDMKADLPRTVRQVAEFIDLPMTQDLLDKVVHQSSLAFMQAHRQQFDDHQLHSAISKCHGLPPPQGSSKVRAGQVGAYQHELPASIVAELDAVWQVHITAHYGFASYEELRTALRAA